LVAKTAALMVCGLLMVSCTAGGGVDTSGLAAILTPDAQTESKNDAATAAAAAAAAAENESAGSEATSLAAVQRPSGVPNVRPSTNAPTPAIENSLVPAAPTNGETQAGNNEVAKAANEPTPKPLSLFARLTAPRPIKPIAETPATATESTTAPSPATSSESAPQPAKKPTGIFANLFQSRSNSTNNQDTVRSGVTTKTSASRPRLGWNTAALPGVRSKKDLFGIDINEELELDDGAKLASVTNQARRGAHGLLLQRKDVKVGCFPPQLVRLLKQVERRFGRTPIVTSGYRSRSYNRLIRGARNSMHIHCKAADIQVQGVSKARLARYLRTLPGRGGVGTYCHTKSVHLDIGKKRDWNRRCRRRRARKS
jgi:uncharacterized protein YcbK (DUF882 family)